MDDILKVFEEAKRCGIAINRLLWEHGDDEDLHAAAEHMESVLWYLEEALGGGEGECPCRKEGTAG